MRDSIVVAFVLSASIAVGGLLYLFGPSVFHQVPNLSGSTSTPGGVSYVTLAQGQNAHEDDRVNYRIMNADQLGQLWDMVYGQTGPDVPNVDFSKNEVLAVFDGSHTTTGYSVSVQNISDADGQRTVTVQRLAPSDSCPVDSTISSPFIIISVPKTSLPLAHVDVPATSGC